MIWSGEFRDTNGALQSGTLTVNGLSTLVPTGQFAVAIDPNITVSVTFTPTNVNLNPYSQTFYFTVDPPYFSGLLTPINSLTPYANFYAVRDYCSPTYRVYNASSGPYSRITWNFGDGFTMTGNSATHAYRAFTNYTITQTVEICDRVPTTCGGGEVFVNCESAVSTQVVEVVPFLPEVSIWLDCGAPQPSSGCSCGCQAQSACACFPVNNTLYVRSSINFNNYSCSGGSLELISCSVPEGIELIGCSGSQLTLISCNV